MIEISMVSRASLADELLETHQCVRCSICVQTCPTGVLNFGQVDKTGRVIKIDAIQASPVQMAEKEAH